MKKQFCVSYSHANSENFIVERLLYNLKTLRAAQYADIWWDRVIPTGSDWDQEIRRKFESADVYFVLVSSEYVASEYVLRNEWPIINRRVGAGAAGLFWVPLDRAVDGFKELVGLQRWESARRRTEPLAEATRTEKEEYLAELAFEIVEYLSGSYRESRIPISSQPQSPREIEAQYLEALRTQCASLLNRDRYLPMQRLYVRLKADERPASELRAGEELAKKSIQAKFVSGRSVNPDTSATEIIEEHLKRMADVESQPIEASRRYNDDSLEDIFQKHRFLVVRGAPGSGKTVLCWKIAVTLAEAWRQEFEYGNPKPGKKMTEFGPARIPILIPVRDYAREFRLGNGDLPLAKYMGRHLAHANGTNAEGYSQFLVEQLGQGRVVLLLDGLDEVPAMDRYQIVESIQAFLRSYIASTLVGVDGTPGDVGGNQLLITSRLAGYELAPITEAVFKHFVIRPFDEQAIEDYCRHWAEIRFKTHNSNFGALGDLMVQSILRASSPTIQELARNPLLLQVLCELAAPWDTAGGMESYEGLMALPRSRAEIYQQAIQVMAKRWELAYEGAAEKNQHLKLLLQPGKMEVLLAHVAFEMHSSEILGRTTAEKLRGWLELAIERVEGTPVFQLPPQEVSNTISALMELIRTHLGVISETAPGVFAFHHLTFQEYLAGKAMCLRKDGKGWESPDTLGRELAKRLPDARWREPALLAFGDLGLTLRQDRTAPSPDVVLASIRQTWRESESEYTSEEVALLVVALVQELPDELVGGLCESAIRELTACYRDWGRDGKSVSIAEPFVHALTLLRRRLIGLPSAGTGNPFDSAVATIVASDATLAAPLARICVDRVWLEPILIESFASARHHDSPNWRWPLHEGLRRALLDREVRSRLLGDEWEPKCIEKFTQPDASAGIQERINYERALDVWRERRQAEQERTAFPVLVDEPKIRALLTSSLDQLRASSPPALRMIMALCGGFKDFQCSRWKAEYAEITHFLQQADSVRSGIISDAPEAFLPRWGTHDVVYNMAVYLDKKQSGRTSLTNLKPIFEVDGISHDPTPDMLRVFEAVIAKPAINHSHLFDLLERLANNGRAQEVAAEAWVAMLASGRLPAERISPNIREMVAWQCGRACNELRDAVVRFAEKPRQKTASASDATQGQTNTLQHDEDNLWSLLDRWLPTLPAIESAEIFKLVMRTLVEATGLPIMPMLAWRGEKSSPLDLAVRGENWAFGFASHTDDEVYNFAVRLDTLGFAANPRQAKQELEAIIGAENFRHFPGASDFLKARGARLSHEASIARFCRILQFLCDAAGSLRPEFREGFFTLVTSGILKHAGPHPFGLLLLGVYCGAGGTDDFPISPAEFRKMQAEIATSPDFAFPISDEWNIGFAEDQLTSPQNTESWATANHELELAVRLCRDDLLSKSDGWKAFTIFAACHVCQQTGSLEIFEEDLWSRLEVAAQAASESFSDILSALVARAGKGGLGLTQSVAETIEALARTHTTEAEDALRCLLPLVEQASPSEVARLRRWVGLEGLDNVTPNMARLLSQHAALILAERVAALEVSWMQPLMDLAQSGDDRSKARVVQTLTSPILSVKRGIRRRHLSALGSNTAIEMVLCYLQTAGDAEPVLRRGLCLDEFHYDDPSIISQLGALIVPDTGISALSFLLGSGTWTTETLEAFAQWLNEDSSRWHDAFVVGFGSLLYYQESDVPASLRASARQSIVSRKLVVHLLREDSSYAEVMKVCQAALDQTPVGLAVAKASALLRESCRIEFSENLSEAEIDSNCAALGESSMQAPGAIPEDCWDVVSPEMDNERLFELVANWLAMELESWSKSRVELRPEIPADIYALRLRNALLSILTVMTERWRDKFALMVSNQQQVAFDLRALLAEAAIHHGLLRAKMAAITLLSRLPSLNAETVAQVFGAAVAADPIVRDRAVMLLPHFRDFVPTPKFLNSAIDVLKGDARASIVLAHAHLLARLLKENKVADPHTRREIVNVLRCAAKAAGNVRLLSHLAGSGTDDDPRHVVNDGRLDEKLLGIVASIYSGFVQSS